MATVAEHIEFSSLVTLCERICKKSGKDKREPLRAFIEKWRSFHNDFHRDNPTTTDSFFPVLRLLLPHLEKERAAYGVKETNLAKLYMSVFCLDKRNTDAQKLLNFRSPKVAKSEAGDFASVAYFILQNRCPEKGSLKISDINSHLDNISTCSASKDKDGMKASLEFLVRHMTALEQKWLIRMILKDMKLGMGENSVLKTYHEDAPDLFNVTNSLEKVCVQLRNPSIRLHEIEISLFAPFRPMLGEQAMLNQVEKLMRNQPFFIETKYDGERLQLHKEGNKFMYFSRNGHDVTHVHGASPLEGKLTPHIAKGFKPHVESCILDGEILIYSSKMKCIVSKGENPDVQYLQPDGVYHSCFCAFDILLVNGEVLSNKPLSERVSKLSDTIAPIPGRIQLTQQKTASTNEEATAALNEAIDRREEGIVIKDPMSVYRPNTRKGGGWLKVKPDYIDDLMDNLDLLIIGGYYGEGRRANKISHFLLGVAESAGEDHTKKFLSVAKVGSGYSDEELDQLLSKLSSHWEVYDARKSIPHIVIGSGRKERPEVWIEPSNSHIVQVRAAEITRSEKFATNYTLRFPRVQTIRYDKSWHECMTIQEFEELRKHSEGRLARTCEMPSDEGPSPKKRRKPAPERTITIAPQFRHTNTSDVVPVSSLLKDKEICVMTMSLPLKQELEKTIVQYGGKFVQNPGLDTFCVIADKVSLRVKNVIAAGRYDVVKDSWLQACIEKQMLLPWSPSDVLFATEITEAKLRLDYDEFGDAYFEQATETSIRQVFANIPSEIWVSKSLDAKAIADIEFRYFSEKTNIGIFRLCCAYIDDKLHVGDESSQMQHHPLQLTAAKLRLYGGTIVSAIDDMTTHVILYSKDTARLDEFKELSKSRRKGHFHIVTEKWVERSIRHQNMLQEKEFMPK